MKKKIIKISFILLAFYLIVNAQDKQPIVKSFPVISGENLKINVDPGNIEIETWNKSEVKIEVESKSKYEVENLVAEKEGNTVKFYLKIDNSWNSNITVKVKTPSNLNFDLETTGGNISIENDIRGNLEMETEGGNVSFHGVKGQVIVKTSGGNISGENVEGEVNLHTSGGNISLGNVKNGKSVLNTYGGNISVGNVVSDLSAKTHGGNLSIGTVGGNANVFTYGGHISMDKVSGSATMETYGGHLNLEGASGEVIAKTTGGHISLENITGSIEASTSGGHVSAELDPKINTNSSLSTAGGHMSLSIPSSAKATIEVFLENDDVEYKNPTDILKSDFPSAKFDVNKGAGEIRATYILNGGGAKINLECIGGDVKIKKWNK